jgi:hypothetical protein
MAANPEICRERAKKSLAVAAALVPAIGYDRAAEMAKEALRDREAVSACTGRLACRKPSPASRTHLLPESELRVVGLRFHLGRRLLLGGQTQLPGRIRQGHRTLRMDASPRIRPLSADGALLGVRFRNHRSWFLHGMYWWRPSRTADCCASRVQRSGARVASSDTVAVREQT